MSDKSDGIRATLFGRILKVLVYEYGDRDTDPAALNEIIQLANKIVEAYLRMPVRDKEPKP